MIQAIPVPGKKKSADICKAFIAGAPKSATGYCFYGVNETNLSQYRVAKRSGLPVYVIDNSAFDCVRGVQFRVTKDRYHHDGRGKSDGRRFGALGLEVQPPRAGGEYVLAVEQSESYMHCVGVDRYWLVQTLRTHLFSPVKVREWQRDKAAASSTLAVDLEHARLTVTHSSAAAVESLLAGVPVLVSPMSPCHGVTMADRRRLFEVLADQQFTLDELRSGVAWRAVNE